MGRLAGILLLAAVALAETPGEAADAVLACKGDTAQLERLAARAEPDPWRVAEELCARGEREAARAFAKAVPGRADTKKLAAYVEGRGDIGGRDGIAAAEAALRQRDAQAVLRALATLPDGPSVSAARAHHLKGLALRHLRRMEESAAAYGRAADHARDIGWLEYEVDSAFLAGAVHFRRGNWRGARTWWERMLALQEGRGDPKAVAAALGNLAAANSVGGEFGKALALHEREVALWKELDRPRNLVSAVGNMAITQEKLGEFKTAAKTYEEALALAGRLGLKTEQIGLRANFGLCLMKLGRYDEALSEERQSYELALAERSLDDQGRALGNMALIRQGRGEYAQALDLHERALRLQTNLRNALGVARTLGNLGNLHDALGDLDAAEKRYGQALVLAQRLKARVEIAGLMTNLADVHKAKGEYDKALALHERARVLHAKTGSALAVALADGNIAGVQLRMGKAEAVPTYERALAAFERAGAQEHVVQAKIGLGVAYLRAGRRDDALAQFKNARRAAGEIGAGKLIVRSLQYVAHAHLANGDAGAALAAARDAVERLPLMLQHLSDETGAQARETWLGIFDTGVRAAIATGRVEDVSYFLESGRAGALLESLGGRNAVRTAVVPDELLKEEAVARADAQRARDAHRRAVAAGKRKEIKARRAVAEATQRAYEDAVRRIQREAKAAAAVVYPTADALADIQAGLKAGDALVTYHVSDQVRALVVTRGSAFVHALDDETLVKGLRLPKDVTRLLVSPDGRLAYVPFATLTDLPICYVPSGTTLRHLRETDTARGTRVLALGGPVYAKARGLAALPATKLEAETIGDTVLLGENASKARLAAACRRGWRAVHLACHGRVDTTRPMRSGLALSDGDLRCLDIYRWDVQADLVVLSACETGKGKVHRAEGIVGFTRAFMFAGAPRVIVSLWKVDDDATRALMEKFYELWKPGTIATAVALRKAQDFVRSHEKWSDEKYWAAWQLWGLPD